MGKLFKEAFPLNHREISCKFGALFFVYEAFLISRVICYYLLLFTKNDLHEDDVEYTEEYIVFYTTEIILIAFLSYVSLKST